MKKHNLILILVVIFVILSINKTFSQRNADSIKVEMHSPHKASIYSALLPGLGQIYNHQTWKVPILYAGIATIAYFAVFNTTRFHNYKDEYLARLNNDSSSFNPDYELFSTSIILQLKNYYQRNLEFTYIMAGVVYLLNIIDASVYAHLFSFDVGNDLTLKLDPLINNNSFRLNTPPVAGVKLTLRF